MKPIKSDKRNKKLRRGGDSKERNTRKTLLLRKLKMLLLQLRKLNKFQPQMVPLLMLNLLRKQLKRP